MWQPSKTNVKPENLTWTAPKAFKNCEPFQNRENVELLKILQQAKKREPNKTGLLNPFKTVKNKTKENFLNKNQKENNGFPPHTTTHQGKTKNTNKLETVF